MQEIAIFDADSYEETALVDNAHVPSLEELIAKVQCLKDEQLKL